MSLEPFGVAECSENNQPAFHIAIIGVFEPLMKILDGVTKVYHSSVKRLAGAFLEHSVINSCAVEIKVRK